VVRGAPTGQAPPLRIEEVKDGLYNIIGSGGNVGALVTSEGVILIDDKFEENYDGIVESVRSVTDQPIKYVINTHYHADHSGGNTRFLEVAEVISTRNARTKILEQRQSNAPPGVMPAGIVFTEEASIFLGGQEVRARHFGRGHTNSDAIIYFPALRTVHMGDMMAGSTPLIDYNGGGSMAEWTNTVDSMTAEFDFDTVIPGHGAVTDPAGLRSYRDDVETLRNRVTGLIREGRSQDEIGQILEEDYPSYSPGSLHTEWSLPGFMTELR
jgi:glyoxylase-like metal-dependent hydrolase (beta-lactamase superfamily II)